MVKAAQPKTQTPPTADLLAQPTQPEPLPVVDLGAVQSTDDVVEYTLRCVLAMAPGLTDAIRQHIQATAGQQVRAMFGGERVYVGKKPGEGRFARNAQIRRDYKAGERIHLLERRYGLSASRLWQIINE